MKRVIATHARWLTVVVFAIGMAWVESASVYYIRTIVDRVVPYQADPLPFQGNLGQVELIREAATLVMLLTLGMLAGRTWRSRLGYASIAFGVWDIFYYVFLRLMCGWPQSLFDWDILFLLPVPWWGPVAAPVSIAIMMIVWGGSAVRSEGRTSLPKGSRVAWALNAIGTGLALYVFMADSIRQIPDLRIGLPYTLPTAFNWPLFLVAIAGMAVPLVAPFAPRAGWRRPDAPAEPARS
jgi:hypothetical protein